MARPKKVVSIEGGKRPYHRKRKPLPGTPVTRALVKMLKEQVKELAEKLAA